MNFTIPNERDDWRAILRQQWYRTFSRFVPKGVLVSVDVYSWMSEKEKETSDLIGDIGIPCYMNEPVFETPFLPLQTVRFLNSSEVQAAKAGYLRFDDLEAE
jgi:hypothetical protein